VEVSLVTVFVLAIGSQYILHRQRVVGPTIDVNKSAKSIWAALHTSLGLFWDTALLFNLAVMIAAFVSVAEENSA